MALTSAERMRQGRVTDADGREVSSIYVARPVVVVGNDPAAGAEISVTVPANEVWELLAVRFELVTSAAVATREPLLRFTDGTTTYLDIPDTFGQVASLTLSYNYGGGFPSARGSQSLYHVSPLPRGLVLPPGHSVYTTTIALQAGDNFGAPALYVVKHAA